MSKPQADGRTSMVWLTETRLQFLTTPTESMRKAICEWLRAHDVDPMRVVRQGMVWRDTARYRLWTEQFVLDDNGQKLPVRFDEGYDCVTWCTFEQGEGPPLPFPPELPRTG